MSKKDKMSLHAILLAMQSRRNCMVENVVEPVLSEPPTITEAFAKGMYTQASEDVKWLDNMIAGVKEIIGECK